MIRAVLLASATETRRARRRASSALTHCGVLAPGVSHDRGCADDEEGAHISVAHLRDRAETMAVAVMKPTPGIVSSLLLASVARCQARSSTSIALICA